MFNSSNSSKSSNASEAKTPEIHLTKLSDLSEDETIEAFNSINDLKYPQNALVLFKKLSDILGVKPKDIGVEQLIFNPYQSLESNIFAIPLNERYTPQALALIEKLERLKKACEE